ncbi:MAG: hypothetical protein AB7U38_10105 [Hyphomicrobiales bacterium]
MSHALRGGLSRLETTTKITLAVLALASGVYTYLGVRGLLSGSSSLVFFGAIIYSAAVSVGIYAFWSYMIRFLPHIRHADARRMLYGAMVLGSGMIIAMSSWLNAAALAGSAALAQHMAVYTEKSQQALDEAHNTALAAQGLLPDIQLASQRFARLAAQEKESGSLTGTSGSGTVVQLLTQMSGQLSGLAEEVRQSRTQVRSLFEQGGQHLSRMRQIVSSTGPIEPRRNAFAEEAVALTGVIAGLKQTSIAPAVKRAAEDLSRSFIAPVADGSTASLAARQTEVVGNVEKAIREQSKALSAAADDILNRPEAVPARFTPLSTPEAVLLYATDFLPSWAGAISIDLLPAVFILVLCIVQAVIRREEGDDHDEHEVTAAEMRRAMRIYQRLGDDKEEAAPRERDGREERGDVAGPQRIEALPSARTRR